MRQMQPNGGSVTVINFDPYDFDREFCFKYSSFFLFNHLPLRQYGKGKRGTMVPCLSTSQRSFQLIVQIASDCTTSLYCQSRLYQCICYPRSSWLILPGLILWTNYIYQPLLVSYQGARQH
jgi:hypothetical protein